MIHSLMESWGVRLTWLDRKDFLCEQALWNEKWEEGQDIKGSESYLQLFYYLLDHASSNSNSAIHEAHGMEFS